MKRRQETVSGQIRTYRPILQTAIYKFVTVEQSLLLEHPDWINFDSISNQNPPIALRIIFNYLKSLYLTNWSIACFMQEKSPTGSGP
jgi:hypothetical protein